MWSCPPGRGVRQHDPVGVEGAVQGEQALVAAEEPDVRSVGHADRPLGTREVSASAVRRVDGC